MVNDDGLTPLSMAALRGEVDVLHQKEREFCIGDLLVRIHLIIETILVDRPCAMGV